jgi:hypothetical protein
MIVIKIYRSYIGVRSGIKITKTRYDILKDFIENKTAENVVKNISETRLFIQCKYNKSDSTHFQRIKSQCDNNSNIFILYYILLYSHKGPPLWFSG